MKRVLISILVVLSGLILTYFSFTYKKTSSPNVYYMVYLNEEELGVINSKEELENYIDEQNEVYKKKFNVNKVYAPNGLRIEKVYTYSKNVDSVKEIYKKISKIEPFTIIGYQFNIKKEDSIETIYTLDKATFNEAVESLMITFVGSEKYEEYKNGTQSEITTTGAIIEDIYVEENKTIKKTKIPVTETIYTDETLLAKYLLFGTTEDQGKYIVKVGDTIESVAFNNKISVEEFLISNPNFTNEKNLLFPGQEVVIGITNPKISIVVNEYVVEDKEVNYQEEYQYDEDRVIGDDEILQRGENGLERVSQKQQIVNGLITNVEVSAKEELKSVINQIVLKGEKNVPTVGSLTNWLWPTNSGYTISSNYIYRINPITGARELHSAIDISGTGYASPIYAVTNGVVSLSEVQAEAGNYVCINHNNGYYTCYAHMAKRNVVVGQVVARGQIIGYVGRTGYATGPHLHFEVWVGTPWKGGYRINPWKMY